MLEDQLRLLFLVFNKPKRFRMNLKNQLLLLLFGLYSCMAIAQKVDIDNHSFYIEFAAMPEHYVPVEERTFTVDVQGANESDLESINDAIKMYGWTRNDEAANVKAVVEVKSFVQGKSKVEDRTEVKKNKAGKVTSRTTYYKVQSTNMGRAMMSVYGPEMKYVKPEKKKKKKKKKEKEKKANPFLTDVSLEANEEQGMTAEDRVAYKNLSKEYTYSTAEHTKRSKATSTYSLNAETEYNKHFDKYYESLAGLAGYALNSVYGFNRDKEYAKFKRLDSDKHPEFEMFENALQATRAILEKKKKFNSDPAEINAALAPIVEYFITVKEKYNQDKKHPKRLKAAAMYNLAQIYYYTDMPDKVIEIGNEYIRWDHDEDDGEDFIEKAEKLKHLLEFHKADGRYVLLPAEE